MRTIPSKVAIRALHVINSLDVGGAESLLVNFVQASPAHCAMEVCVLYPSGPLRERLLSSRVPLHDLNLPYKYAIWKAHRLSQLIRSGRYDIVHAHLFPSVWLTALASYRAKGPRYLFTEHGSWNRRRRFYGFRSLDHWIYSRYSKLICVSPAVGKSLTEWLPSLQSRMVVIPSGVALPPEDTETSAPSHDLIFVGRLERVKGLDILLSALALLKPKGHHPSLLVVGTGKQEVFLRQLAHHLGVSPQVTFLGYRSDVQSLLGRARIFVLPSRTEGLPVSLLEAMAAGKAIVATSAGGIADVVEHNQEALLVPPEDPMVLAQAIAEILKDPQRFQRMGKAAQAKARACFSMERFVRDMIGLYEKVLE